MIAFASLFLGLVLGWQPVELLVAPEVARVEVRLDGRPLATLVRPPWRVTCDLGKSLEPHELAAVAFDGAGLEIGRASQWLNLPRHYAEAEALIERQADGSAIARLSWQSVTGDSPREVVASLDGRPLSVRDRQRLELPPHDLASLHFLHVEGHFADGTTALVELAFGGTYAERVATELTAIPLRTAAGAPPLTPPALEGRLVEAGRALPVVAVDRGAAEVIVVLERSAQPALARLAGMRLRLLAGGNPRPSGAHRRAFRASWTLASDERLRFLWPFAERHHGNGQRSDLFPSSNEHVAEDGGLLWLMTQARFSNPGRAEQRLADAVAVAGLKAIERGRRRAVLLILGPEASDASQASADLARSYLRSVRVPLRVWSVATPAPELAADWGDVAPAATLDELGRAFDELALELSRQQLVWVEGTHLPQRVALAAGADELELAE